MSTANFFCEMCCFAMFLKTELDVRGASCHRQLLRRADARSLQLREQQGGHGHGVPSWQEGLPTMPLSAPKALCDGIVEAIRKRKGLFWPCLQLLSHVFGVVELFLKGAMDWGSPWDSREAVSGYQRGASAGVSSTEFKEIPYEKGTRKGRNVVENALSWHIGAVQA